MYVSTTFPTFPVSYGVRAPFLRTAFARSATPARSGEWIDGAYALAVDLPGVPEDAVAVAVAGRTLTIDVTTDTFRWSERIRLPQTLDPEQVSARYVNGRLTVTIGKTAEALPRSIAVETTPAPRAELVEAQSDETEASVTE